jgi:hypothetical protein
VNWYRQILSEVADKQLYNRFTRTFYYNRGTTFCYCGLNPSPNALILFFNFFLHVLDSVSELRTNLT